MKMASSLSVIPSQRHPMDRTDAALALLGVSPPSQSLDSSSSPNTSRLSTARVTFGAATSFSPSSSSSSRSILGQATAQKSHESSPPLHASSPASSSSLEEGEVTNRRTVSFESQQQQQPPQPPPSSPLTGPAPSTGLNALDALAALASSEQASLQQPTANATVSSSLVPAVTFTAGSSLIVSASTTGSSSASSEDEDDADAMPPPPPRTGGRRRSVSNPEGMEKWAPLRFRSGSSSRRDFVLPASILEEELAEASAAMRNLQQKLPSVKEEEGDGDLDEDSGKKSKKGGSGPVSGLMSEEEQANLTPEELLKRARSRLLEDLSEGNLNGEKGVLTLPHSLSKYKEVYNKNGRIGIYTPAERAAIIARFQRKRSRRVWNKKIRYNCRKNLADRRMRVKGRFVKRSTEEQARAEATTTSDAAATDGAPAEDTTPEPSETADEDMPDVTDPDAGFCPTDDQPFRRTRRHTIT